MTTTVQKPLLTLAGLLLALGATIAVAQTTPTKPTGKTAAKTLNGKAAGNGKLMTREELRACLKRLDDLNQSGKEVDALRPPLDRERDELKASGEALKVERVEVDRQAAEVTEWNNKMRVLAADIEAFNKRSTAAQEAPRNQQEKMAEELKADRERLQKTRDALAADEARLVPVYQSTAKAYNDRALARDAKVADWNQRNAAAGEASVKQQEERALWLNECANRPYREDDEKAIRAGK
jgi:chromosome segregation ATPase